MTDEEMFFVAIDPAQPDAAYAACADDPRWAIQTAIYIAEWKAEGATIHRVDRDTMRAMLKRWIRNAN